MSQNEYEAAIRSYLQGSLSPVERKAFELAVDADPELAQALALQYAEWQIGELLLEAQARAWISAHRPARRPVAAFWRNPLAVRLLLAASVALAVAAIGWFSMPDPWRDPISPLRSLRSESHSAPAGLPAVDSAQAPRLLPPTANEPPEPDRFLALARNELEEPALRSLRGSPSDSAQSAFRLAEQAYARGGYRQALELLAQTDSSQQQMAAFLSAHTLFRLGRLDAAARQFKYLVEIQSRQFRYDSEWALAMCYLAQKKDRKKAFGLLRQIAYSPDHPYAERAISLRTTLNRYTPE